MLVSEMQTELSLHLNDVAQAELTAAQLLTFIQSAARDFRSTGWLIRMEDNESLTVLANTPEYNVPATFAYIQDIWMERVVNGVSQFDIQIPRGHWTPRINGGVPVIFFYTQSALETGRLLKIVGQARPTIYTAAGNTIDVGMEYVLRERALSYALMSVAAGGSELARWRQQTSLVRRQLQRPFPPKDFRQLPGSQIVPGRQ